MLLLSQYFSAYFSAGFIGTAESSKDEEEYDTQEIKNTIFSD